MDTRTGRQRDPRGNAPSNSRNAAPSGIVLWRPEIVLATSMPDTDGAAPIVTAPRARVTLAQPVHAPDRVKTRIEATRSLLSSLVEARRTLDVHTRLADGGTERERVSATIETYRAEAALDDVLQTASRQVTTLMKERGLR